VNHSISAYKGPNPASKLGILDSYKLANPETELYAALEHRSWVDQPCFNLDGWDYLAFYDVRASKPSSRTR